MLERRVAVKILRPALGDDAEAVARFRREARHAARVNHVGVVAMYDTVSGDGCDAMVQELIDGTTLRDVLDARPKLSIGEAVRVGLALADALAGVHTVGIVHRDLHPGNVLLADDGRILLTDFGYATRQRHPLTADDLALPDRTYLSPEQVEGEPASVRADVYALGVVLYQCLAGRPPFAADAEAGTGALVRSDAIPLGSLRPAVPSRLARLVRACLSRSPDDRPRSATSVRDALAALLPDIVEDVVTPTRPPAAVPDGVPDATAGAGGEPSDDTGPHAALGDDTGPHPAVDAPATTAPGGATTGTAPVAPTVVVVAGHPRRRWPLVAAAIVASVLGAFTLNVLSGRPVGDIGQPAPDAAAAAEPATTAFTVAVAAVAQDAPATTAAPAAAVTVTAAPAAPGPVTIVSVGEFDPAPGDGRENPAQLGNLIDGRPQTVWSSLCYDEVGLGRKDGVGLVFELSGPAAGHALQITSTTRGWSASAFVSADRPTSLKGWGTAVSTRRNVAEATESFPLEDAGGRYVLLWFTQLGKSPVCKLPFDVRIAEVALS